MGSLISLAHREKVHGMVETGRGEGAEVVAGGEPTEGDGAFYPPTVLAGVASDQTVAQEEIFGPVIAVIPFEDEKDAVRIANDVRYGLVATVWTGDPARGHRLARSDQVGHVHDQPPVRSLPRRAVRRLQAVRLRPRAGARDAPDVPGDEERAPLDGRAPDEPLGPLAPARRA